MLEYYMYNQQYSFYKQMQELKKTVLLSLLQISSLAGITNLATSIYV